MERFFVFVLLTVLALSACSQTGQEQSEDLAQREALMEKLEGLEQQLIKAEDVRKEDSAAREYIAACTTFQNSYPSDTLSDRYLFRAADVARGLGEYGVAIKLWGQLWRTYPDAERAPDALFLQGFTYDNDLQDAEMASRYYQKFLDNYPDHPYSGQAEQLLKVLDRSPEELIREFEKK